MKFFESFKLFKTLHQLKKIDVFGLSQIRGPFQDNKAHEKLSKKNPQKTRAHSRPYLNTLTKVATSFVYGMPNHLLFSQGRR